MIVRGVDRREIFRDDADRAAYCDRLSVVLPEDGATCFAWALMPNHVHLAIRTGARPLARVMHRVGTRYGRYFNERHGRVGYLFQGRYKAIAIADDAYLATLVRYVHRNPLRAGIVASLDELDHHRWTGHPALVGYARAEPFHDVRESLLLFGESETMARASVRELMLCAEDDPEAPSTTAVDDAPVAAPTAPSGPSREVDPALALAALIDRVCRAQHVPETELRRGSRCREVSLARATIAYLAFHELGVSIAEVARQVGVSRQSLWERMDDGRDAALMLAPIT